MEPTLKVDKYIAKLVEIGRITTTWAKFEHWIEQAIWIFAGVEAKKGACMTTQIGSIHGKFRALIALMHESGRPDDAIRFAKKLGNEAAAVIQERTKFAHGPLDVGVDLDLKEFEVYLRRVAVRGEIEFETALLTDQELIEANNTVSNLYMKLRDNWLLLVGDGVRPDPLAPPHKSEVSE